MCLQRSSLDKFTLILVSNPKMYAKQLTEKLHIESRVFEESQIPHTLGADFGEIVTGWHESHTDKRVHVTVRWYQQSIYESKNTLELEYLGTSHIYCTNRQGSTFRPCGFLK